MICQEKDENVGGMHAHLVSNANICCVAIAISNGLHLKYPDVPIADQQISGISLFNIFTRGG